MIEPHAIDHVVLRTDRPEDLVEFYCEVLGCDVERVVEEHGLVQLRAGTSLIDIVDVAGTLGAAGGRAPGTEGHNVDHFCLRITPFDEDGLVRHLEAHGVECGEFHRRYGAQGYGRSLYIQDPAGNTVELKAQV